MYTQRWNQRRTNYVHVIDVNTVYFVHLGKSVARSLLTLTINEHTITNVCLNLSLPLKLIYIMIKYTFQINF